MPQRSLRSLGAAALGRFKWAIRFQSDPYIYKPVKDIHPYYKSYTSRPTALLFWCFDWFDHGYRSDVKELLLGPFARLAKVMNADRSGQQVASSKIRLLCAGAHYLQPNVPLRYQEVHNLPNVSLRISPLPDNPRVGKVARRAINLLM